MARNIPKGTDAPRGRGPASPSGSRSRGSGRSRGSSRPEGGARRAAGAASGRGSGRAGASGASGTSAIRASQATTTSRSRRRQAAAASGSGAGRGRSAGSGAPAPKGPSRVQARASGSPSLLERMLSGAPAKVMEPRVHFILALCALVVLGLVMVFSASSIRSLEEGSNPYGTFIRQVAYCAVGLVALVCVAVPDYHRWCGRRVLWALWILSVVVLVVTRFAGTASHGASRWIYIGSFSLQPSEFVKLVVVITAANLLVPLVQGVRERGLLGCLLADRSLTLSLVMGIVVPVLLILIQPDKGTTLVISVTLLVMLVQAGLPLRWAAALGALGIVAFLLLGLRDEYSRLRLLAMLDPRIDPNGASYQLLHSLYAFAGGGIWGVGLGMSHQKYSYLPEAHNDFILAVAGEELGLVGMVVIIALFALLVFSAFRIAVRAPDMEGQLIASGCAMLIVVAFMVNLMGVSGIFPMTGKAVPFLSSGGSSMISSMMVAGLILSVSRQSRLPETSHERRRAAMGTVAVTKTSPTTIAGRDLTVIEGSQAGEARPRSLRLVNGGASSQGRSSADGGGSRGDGVGRSEGGGRQGPGGSGASPVPTRRDDGGTSPDRGRTSPRRGRRG